LRMLVVNGYLEDACETTQYGAAKRKFNRKTKARFTKRTCFVLTPAGADLARAVCAGPKSASSGAAAGPVTAVPARGPYYDGARRILFLDGREVLRFRRPAPAQEILLLSFQEQNWQEKIDDPLPRVPDTKPDDRLRNTVSNLNRRLGKGPIRFGTDDGGRTVYWRRA